jgi:WD40 repeat protein
VWQHPYVDVMRQLGVFEGKHAKVVGDVRVLLDPTLNKQVLCIKGAVSAANYLELPGPGTTAKERTRNPAAARTTALGLTGDYIYLQIRAMADKYFVIHIDVQTTQGLIIRLSISNIFKFIKLQNHGRVLQLPCDFLSTKWTVLALHLPSLLEECSNNVQSMHAMDDVVGGVEGEEGFSAAAFAGSASARSHTSSTTGGASAASHLKYIYSSIQRIQFCSSLFVRNVVTSSHRYTIGTFPKDVRYFLPRSASFDDCYEWFWIVTPPTKEGAQTAQLKVEEAEQEQGETDQLEEMEAIAAEQRLREKESLRAAGASQIIAPEDLRSSVAGLGDSQQRLWDPHGRAPNTPLKSSVPVQVFSGVDVTQSPNRQASGSTLHQSHSQKALIQQSKAQQAHARNDASRRGSNASQQKHAAAAASLSASSDSGNNRPLTTAEFDEPQQQQRPPPAALLGGVGARADASVPTHSPLQARQAQAITAADRAEYEESKQGEHLQESISNGARIVRHIPTKDATAASSSAAGAGSDPNNVLSPDPVLALDKIIGYSASRTTSNLCWSPCGQYMIYPSNNVLVISNVRTGAQEFLTGHTENIAVVSVSSNGIIASGQSGRSPLIRLWNFQTRACIGILMAHSSDLKCLCFSFLNLMLGAVGRDAQGRVLIVIWDISAVLDTGAIHVVAKQLSDYSINRLLFSPFRDDPLHLISVGHESIRFWRIKTKHLPGSSLQLNEHARNTFTAIAFEAKYGEADHTTKRMYVATASGSLFQINYASRQLECIYKLHSGPIYSLDINEGFAVTGSGDCFLRVWPLDFSDFYCQAQHKGAITAVGMSTDGLNVLVGSENGCIGVLDLSSTAYQTRLRAHLDTIYAVAFDPHRDEFATVSKDGTIRVFGIHSLEQIYEFYSPHESVLCVAYHPLASEYRLACGFASGSMRIMDIATTSMHVDYAQHQGRVLDVVFANDGLFLYSNGEDGNICAYDVSKNYLPIRMFTTSVTFHNY